VLLTSPSFTRVRYFAFLSLLPYSWCRLPLKLTTFPLLLACSAHHQANLPPWLTLPVSGPVRTRYNAPLVLPFAFYISYSIPFFFTPSKLVRPLIPPFLSCGFRPSTCRFCGSLTFGLHCSCVVVPFPSALLLFLPSFPFCLSCQFGWFKLLFRIFFALFFPHSLAWVTSLARSPRFLRSFFAPPVPLSLSLLTVPLAHLTLSSIPLISVAPTRPWSACSLKTSLYIFVDCFLRNFTRSYTLYSS